MAGRLWSYKKDDKIRKLVWSTIPSAYPVFYAHVEEGVEVGGGDKGRDKRYQVTTKGLTIERER